MDITAFLLIFIISGTVIIYNILTAAEKMVTTACEAIRKAVTTIANEEEKGGT